MEQRFVWEKIKQEVLRCLSVLTGAEGRFDYIVSPKRKSDRYRGLCAYTGCLIECAGHDKESKKRT